MRVLLYIGIIIVGYLIGCMQSAYITGRLSKIDIREHGSKNAGATNVFMILGWKKGAIVGVFDILKAAIPVFIMTRVFPNTPLLAITMGVAVVLGHIFPVFLRFKGGKGTASIMGMLLGLNPWLFLIAFVIMVVVTFITDYIALGTLAMLIVTLIALILFKSDLAVILVFVGISLVNMALHLVNFRRIKKGTETGLKSVLKKED